MKKYFRRILTVAIAALSLLLFFLVLAVVLIQTGPGQRLIERSLNNILIWDQGHVTVGGLSGNIPFNVTVEHISIHDAQGEWLNISRAALRWSFARLFVGKICIHELGAESVILSRLPETEKTEKEPFSLPEEIKWSWPLPDLTVHQVYVSKAVISDRVLDERFELGLRGSLTADESGSLAGLEINRLDKPASIVSFNVRLEADPYYLDLDLAASDAGALPSMLPLEPWPSHTSIRLKGAGPLKSWTGKLTLDGQDMFSAALDLSVDHEDIYYLLAQGDFYINPLLLPLKGFGYSNIPFAFLLRAGLDQSERILIDGLEIYSPSLALKTSAMFDPAKMKTSGSVSLDIPDINPLLMNSGFKSNGPFSFSTVFEGPVEQLSANVGITQGEISGHGLSLNRATIAADFFLQPSDKTLYAANGNIDLAAFTIRQYDSLPPDLNFSFSMDHSLEHVLNLNKFIARARDLDAEVDGVFDLKSLQFSGNLDLSASSAQQFIPGLDRDAFFSANMNAAVVGGGDIRKNNYSIDSNIVFMDLQADNPMLEAIAGSKARLTGRVSFDDQMVFRVCDARLAGDIIDLYGSGDMDFKHMVMDYSGRLDIPSLEALGSKLGISLAGDAGIDGSARGKISGPDLEVKVSMADFRYEHLDPADIEARADAAFTDGPPLGNIALSISQKNKSLEVLTDYAFAYSSLEISSLTARGYGIEAEADLVLDLSNSLTRGRVLSNVSRLDHLGELLDLDISGSLESEVTLDHSENNQNLSLVLIGQDIEYSNYFISGLQATGRAENILDNPWFQSDLEVSGAIAPNARIDRLAAKIKGSPDRMSFFSTLSGRAVHPIDLSVRGNYLFEDSEHSITLSELRGKFAQETFQLDSSLVFAYSQDRTALNPFRLNFGSGTLSAEAELTRDRSFASVSLHDLPLMEIPVDNADRVLGMLNLDLLLTGSPDNPDLEATINLDQLAPADYYLEIPHALDFHADITLKDHQASINAGLLENQTSIARLDLSLPVLFSVQPFKAALPDSGPLSGEFESCLELETLAMLMLPPDHLLSGVLNTDIFVSGSLDEPVLTGNISIHNASYEFLDAGFYITEFQAEATAEQTMVTIDRISASDGLNGRIRGRGSINLDPSTGMPWNLEMDINGARLINHNLAEAFIEQGSLKASGSNAGADIQGQITVGNVQARIPDHPPPSVTDLEVTEINHVSLVAENDKPSAGIDYPVSLDIELAFPSRVYVRGRGLESEWQGELHVGGKAAEPLIRGNLNVVRGRMEVLDRRFDLDRESYISLDGGFPPDPFVDIMAEYRRRDMIINARVYGPALNPELELSSDPHMPQDEILAWVLFGRDLSNITPFQAVALANAARTLTTGQTGPDIMGEARSLLGVDDIDITRDPDEGHMQFGLGKYVHERVYVEVKKGTKPGTDAISAEVELTPRISLESSLESDSEGEIGLFWKYDY